MARNDDFLVRVNKTEAVSAALPVQEYWLPLSNLDLMLPPVDFCVFFCYERGDVAFASMVVTLKKALAETLAPYYAFAGEITTNSLGEPELLCNNYGVEFSEARAYVNLHDLDLYRLEKSIYRLFPEKTRGVMAVQATELNCGSLIVTCRVDHRIADAYSANLFFVSWAESARSMPISVVPSFRRSLLSSRHPPKHSPSMDELYMPLPPVSSPPKPKRNPDSDSDLDEFVSRVFYVEASKIDEIQCLASSEYSRVTKLEAFCAFLWKLTAKTEQKSGGARKAALGIVIDGRTRLGDNGVNNMGSYIGNVLTAPFRQCEMAELVRNPLGSVAREVHGVIETGTSREHFMGLIDWIEAQRPKPITPKAYWVNDGPAVMVSSGRRFPVREVDFGWGPPALGSYYFSKWGSPMGYVMPMPSATVDGDWVVYTVLPRRVIHVITEEAADMFRPMTNQYLTGQTV